MWIGTDRGIDYYDYRTDRINHFSINSERNEELLSVNSILCYGDSLIWVASRSSLLKMSIRRKNGKWTSENITRYDFNLRFKQITDQISCLCFQNDSTLWIGIRGNSAISLNTATGENRQYIFNDEGFESMNDVLCIHIDSKENIWFGTSYGMVHLYKDGDGMASRSISINEGLINNTIHGITEAGEGKLWLSTNDGLILFDPLSVSFRNYNRQAGIHTIEYCDNAYFRDERDSLSFFGGVDGLVWINDNIGENISYVPEIQFTNVKIYNKDSNITDFSTYAKETNTLVLSHDQDFFSIGFIAVDYINGSSGTYSYKLENFHNAWINTTINEAQFTNVSPGDYTLYVRYSNGYEQPQSAGRINIRILPPWYLTKACKIAALLLLLTLTVGIIFFISYKIRERDRNTDRLLKEKYKEEVYESKLRFFTNITHEFCTPLSLIYAPCNKLLSSSDLSPETKKYVDIIRINTERLNSLIQEAIDFRKVETGNATCSIRRVRVGAIINNIKSSFEELAFQNRILFHVDCDPELEWNSDESCLNKILNNLISNALKYTPEGGEVAVSIKISSSDLNISVYNTGIGIPEKEIPKIFDRYTILDNVSEPSPKSLMARNGLGLSICQSMVHLLKGEIEVFSKVNEYTEFVVKLPYLQEDISEAMEEKVEPVLVDSDMFMKDSLSPKPSILVIDDNRDMLWMLRNIFSEDYQVITAETADEGLEMVKDHTPDIIVSDVMMPGTDGLSFSSILKKNKHTMQIPIILLSAKGSTQDMIEGIEAGADLYISKPFDIDYIKAAVRNLLQNTQNMSSYYKSSASAFEFSKGKLVSREDRLFLEKVERIIKENLSNSEFTPQNMADLLNMGLRNLYRKFSSLQIPTPKEFLKTSRINHAAYLLRTSSMTIEEVMYNSGFTNRSNFYKVFAKHTGQIPGDYRKNAMKRDEQLR